MKDLTNSNIDRQNILNNHYALTQIQEYIGLPGMLFEGEYRFTKEMAGYILGGAVIGGASGGAAVGASAAGGGAMLAGAAAGAVGGGGFSGLAGNNILTGAVNGALTGLVGGGIGSAIGGGWGALAGGTASNITGQLLSTGDVNWTQAGVSGALSFGMYQAMMFATWELGGKNLGGNHLSYRQFSTMSADFQRSRFWQKEYGEYLLNDGSVDRFSASSRHYLGVDPPPAPDNAFASYHTHWEQIGINVGINPLTADKASTAEYLNGAYRIATTARYPSQEDLMFNQHTGLDSYVINRYDASFSNGGTRTFQPLMGNWFIRYFLFNW